MVDPENPPPDRVDPTGPRGKVGADDAPDPGTERRVRQALTDAVADIDADDRLHSLVADRWATTATPRTPRPWLVAAALILVVGVAGAWIAVNQDGSTTNDIDRVATEPPVTTTTSTSTTVTTPFQGWGWMSTSPIGPRTATNTASTWTGTELIVWGEAGSTAPGADNRSGAAYDPTTDTWQTIAPSPVESNNSMAVWTGDEMVVGPARPESAPPESTDGLVYAAYDPEADTWRVLPGTVDGFGGTPIAWTGAEVLLDGGQYGEPALTALDPTTGDRRPVPAPPRPAGDLDGRPVGGTTYLAIDQGRIAAVSGYQSSAARLSISSPDLTTWTDVPVTGIDPNSLGSTLLWTGEELVSTFPGGAAYDPATDQWRRMAIPPDDPGSSKPGPTEPNGPWRGMPSVFTGRYVISESGVYETATDRWTDLQLNAPELRSDPLVAWDGTKVLIWSGMLPCTYANEVCTTPERELVLADGLTFQP